MTKARNKIIIKVKSIIGNNSNNISNSIDNGKNNILNCRNKTKN